jgi:hypothetical protein
MGQDNNMCVSVAALLDRSGLTISEDFGIQDKNTIVAQELLKAQVIVRISKATYIPFKTCLPISPLFLH